VLKSFPSIIKKYARLNGNLKYEPKESCDNFSLPGLGKPNANTGVDRGETSVGIAFGGSGEGYDNTTSEKMTVSSRHRFPQRRLFGPKLDVQALKRCPFMLP
jgi:hypothetical protein